MSAAEPSEDGERVAWADLPDHGAARLDLDARALRNLVAEAFRDAVASSSFTAPTRRKVERLVTGVPSPSSRSASSSVASRLGESPLTSHSACPLARDSAASRPAAVRAPPGSPRRSEAWNPGVLPPCSTGCHCSRVILACRRSEESRSERFRRHLGRAARCRRRGRRTRPSRLTATRPPRRSRSSDANCRAESHSTSWVPSPSSSKSTVMRQSSATREFLPDAAQQVGDLLWRRRAWVRLRTGPLDRRLGDEIQPCSGTPRSLRRSNPANPASCSTRRAAFSRLPIASPKRAISAAATGSLKRSAGGRQTAFRAPCGDSVAAAEGLGHRMAEPEAGAGQGRARVHGALEELAAGVEVASVGEHARQRGGDESAPASASASDSGFRPGDVQRLGAVRERVQRGAAALALGQVEVSSGS